MQYTGNSFEQAVLGHQSSGDRLVQKFRYGGASFSTDVTALIKRPGPECPNTHIGRSLFSLVKSELQRCGIDTKGFIFRSAIDTRVDAHHLTDAIFYIPSIHRFPVTVDLFCLLPSDAADLRDFWISRSDEQNYPELHLVTDLFLFNRGLFRWMKNNGILGNTFVCQGVGGFRRKIRKVPDCAVSVPHVDFRQLADRGRPADLLILTPYHVETSERRKDFARMVARYFAEAAEKSSHKNMALLSR